MPKRKAQTARDEGKKAPLPPPEEDFLADFADLEIEDMDDLDFDMPDGIEETDAFCLPDDRISRPVRMKDIPAHQIMPKNAADLVAKGIVPPPECMCSCVVKGSFEFGDLLGELILAHGGAAELYVATLSMSEGNVEVLAALVDSGLVPFVHVFVSDYFYAHYRHTIYKALFDSIPLDKLQVTVAGTHVKIALMQLRDPAGGEPIPVVIEGSANLRSSQNVEQFAVVNSREHYEFHRAWLDDMEQQFKTIGRKARYYGAGQ